jgi:hypothetical protein
MNVSIAARWALHFSQWSLLLTLVSVSYAGSRSEPLVVVQDGKYGYIDHTGKVIIRPQFIWAEDFWRGLGTVYVCGRYVSVDSSGALQPLRIAIEGRLEPRKEGEKTGFVDASGQFKIAPTFEDALPFSEGLAAVRRGEKWGFIDTSGKSVIQPRFKSAFYFRQGVGVAESDTGYELVDTSGKLLADGFQYVDLITDGRIPASRDGKSGYLDLHGKLVIPFAYDGVRSFSGGLAAVQKGEKWGYVDRNGQVVIPFEFDQAGQFASGLAPAKLGDHSGFIDRSGRFVFSLAFEYSAGFLTGDEDSGLLIAPADVAGFWTTDGRFGYVDTSGHVIWGPTHGSPDHAPLFGWSDEDKTRSCDGVPETTRRTIADFPVR